MASYYVNYNGVNLTNLVRVRTVDTTVLPPRENHAITIWERPGSIYNSFRYGERTITVTFLIRATQQEYSNNPANCMENKLNTLRSVFKVDEPQPLYLGSETRYIYAVPEGDFKMTELRYDCYECEIQFICHNPEYYSASVSASNNSIASTYGMRSTSNNSNIIEVYNGGNASAYPIINIGINDITSFVQIENTTNGNKFLLGSYPKAGIKTIALYTPILFDRMDGVEQWNTDVRYLDSDRGYSGSINATSDGSGFKIDQAATGELELWHGVGAYRKLVEALTDFEVRAKLHLNSYGTDGDPTVPQYIDEGGVYGGSKKHFYKVVASSINIREFPSPDGTIIGTYNKGDYVFPADSNNPVQNGWVVTEDGYCEAVGLKKYIADSEYNITAFNVMTLEEIGLMSRPSDDPSESILLATIDARTALRVKCGGITNGYYKLHIPYNGKIGYVKAEKVMDVSNIGYEVEYPEEEIIVSDDNKTGICEVYGYSSNGTRLFKLCLSDENEFYSFVTPTVYVGDNKALEDITTVSSSNSKAANMDEYNVAYDHLLESSCDWNNFYGELGIRRENNRWQAWIYKIENGATVKKLILKEKEISGAPTEQLDHITIYMGTQDPNNMCGMSITDIQVDRINSGVYDIGCNIAPFIPGDEIKIDCFNNRVYLNNKPYNNMDINSKFIELVSGNNVLKATSDNSSMLVTVLFNERYL